MVLDLLLTKPVVLVARAHIEFTLEEIAKSVGTFQFKKESE